MPLLTTNENTLATDAVSAPVVLVKLTADFCGPCKMYNPILEQFVADTGVPVYNLDIEESVEVAKQYQIVSVPTVLVFKDGVYKESLVGAKPLAALKRDLADYLTLVE